MTEPATTGGAAERYRLVRQIGAGGMAQVVEAIATGASGFERRVAIKWVLPEMADDAAMRRMFLDEARIASHLHHANIVQVIDYGSMDGSEFLVCEYVDGVDMARAPRRRGEPVPATVALHVASEIAHALDHAHARRDASGRALGIVHRDVSPGNILVSWDGDVKLSDFGIAFALLREEQTATGMVKGKASYMAPEQARGEEVTRATDVYALGVTLRVLLTGTSGVLYGMPYGEAPPPLPEDLEALIRGCLAEAPEARPSAREVAEEAERLRQARTTQTGRGELRAWLAPLRDAPARRRAIDQLAGAVVVETSPGSRVFELRRDATAATQAEAAPVAAEPARPASRRGPAVSLAVGLAALALAAGVGAGLLWMSEGAGAATPGDVTPPPGAPAVNATPATPEADNERSGELTGGPASRPTEGDVVDATNIDDRVTPTTPPEVTVTAEEPTPTRRRRRGSSGQGGSPREAPPGETRAAAATGVLRVVGRGAAGNPVYVDGRRVGYAIRDFVVPVGAHHVIVRDRATEAILYEGSASVREAHTSVAPLVLRIE